MSVNVPIKKSVRAKTTTRPCVVFVDDDVNMLQTLRRMMRTYSTEWDLKFFDNSLKAWEFLKHDVVDTVITDMAMPSLTGLELTELMQKHTFTKDIPVIILTGQNDTDLKRRAIDLGATDLLNKPVQLEDLLARVRSALKLKKCYDELQDRNEDLHCRVMERTKQLIQSRQEIVWRLSKAAECRDRDTGRHVIRVAVYTRLIATALGLDEAQIETLFLAAPLHDIGKIGIPDAILLKPDRLTNEERKVMESHCEIGKKILADNLTELDWCFTLGIQQPQLAPVHTDPILQAGQLIVVSHHERWDGNGYPYGLKGVQIPLPGRIVAIADVFDALTSVRPYKPAYSSEQAQQIIHDEAGRHFDPAIYDAFQCVLPEIESMRIALADSCAMSPSDLIPL